MAGEELLELAEKCVREEEVYCNNACPLRVDAKQLIRYVQNGNFRAAYRQYARQVMFPAIVSKICPQPCRNACILKEKGGALQMRAVEAAVCAYGVTSSRAYAGQTKGRSAAVVGGGLFGLCCARLLAEKGYAVRLFEKEGRLGGSLWEEPALTPETIEAECGKAAQSSNLEITLHTEIRSLDELSEYDAVVLATGRGGELFGLDPALLQDGVPVNGHPVLGGGKLTCEDGNVLDLITGGRTVAANVGFALEDASHRAALTHRPTRLVTDLSGVEEHPPVEMSDASGYSREEAVAEAKRCIQCECNACVGGCALLRTGRTAPDACIKEAYQDLNTIDKVEACMMKRQIFSCTLCERCTTVCPKDVDTAKALLTARQLMQKNGKVPPAFHEFWVRDMYFSNHEAGFLLPPREKKSCTHLYFPGCQAAAVMPGAVEKTYDYLNDKLGGAAAMRVGCCGAPAYWAGLQEDFLRELDILRQDWLSLGKPVIITSCPNCHKLLRRFMPEASYVSLWEIVGQCGLPREIDLGDTELAVFDPCAARDALEICDSVRSLLTAAGCSVIELPDNRSTSKCCGHGGLIKRAAPELAGEFARSCVAESDADYVTYCVNCRDMFLIEGKQTRHMLDVLFDLPTPGLAEIADLSMRRENRRRLREKFLGVPAEREGAHHMELHISPELREKMHSAYILEEDIEAVIRHLEESGNRIWDEEKQCIVGCCRVGAITVWVSYRKTETAWEALNVYSHRMIIHEEAEK